MAWESLADFFAVGHNCNNQELIKAVARCARGPYRESLRKAALTWQPTTTFHRSLRQLMLMNDLQPRWYGRINLARITPTVTRVRKELEAYLAGHSPIPPPNRPRPPTNQPQQSKEWLRVEQENKQRFQTWLAKVKQENQHNG